MPKCKNYMLNIPRFYKWQTFDHICFGYVQGIRTALPTMSVSKAVREFLTRFNIDEDTYCFETAKTAYYRILSSLTDEDIVEFEK